MWYIFLIAFCLAVATDPGASVESLVFGGMDTQGSRQSAELSPSDSQFRVRVTAETAYVMCPVVASALDRSKP